MREQGQTLLIAIAIVLFLVLSVPLLVFVTQSGGLHRMNTQRRTKTEPIAQEGVTYALDYFASTQTWANGQAGTFASPCNDGTQIQTGANGSFQLTCKAPGVVTDDTHDARLRPYQLYVKATAWLINGDSSGTYRSIEAFLSQKTLSAATGDGSISVPLALELVNVPSIPATPADALLVHWGPAMVLSSTTWNVVGDVNLLLGTNLAMNTIDPDGVAGLLYPGFPRKFTAGGITGATFARAPISSGTVLTDRREYWASASLEVPPIIDEAYYLALSTATRGINPTGPGITNPGGGACAECGVNPTSCGCIDGGGAGNTVTLDSNFTSPNKGAVIFIRNALNVVVNDAKIDVSSGAFIVVSASMTLGSIVAGDGLTLGSPYNLYVSSSAPQEYSYWPSTATAQWPCSNKVAISPPTCRADSAATNLLRPANPKINIWGFVYAKGGLEVSGANWNLVGGVEVGDLVNGTGQFVIDPGASMTLVYDDAVVAGVHVLNPRPRVDFQQFLSN